MTISFSGLASGLDTSSWVESLVALKQAKINTLEEEKETVLLSKETLNNIKSFFNSFRSVIEKVTDAKFGIPTMDLFAQNLAISANLDVLTATATTEAEQATYNVLVDQLATNTTANSNYSYMTTIIQTTTATIDSKLIHLGVKAGNIGVTVGGIERNLDITENDTIGSFIDKLKEIEVEASYNDKTGVFSVDLDKNAINDIGNTGIVDALHLDGVNEGYTSDALKITNTDTVYSAATRATLISELGAKNGVMVVNANDTNYNITLTSTSTLGSFIDDLKKCNINATLDETGILTIEDANIINEGTTDIKNALGLDLDVYSNTQKSTDLSHKSIITQTTNATSSTLLKDLGEGINITGNQTVILKNSNNTYATVTVNNTTTVGDLLAKISNTGLYAALNEDGTVEITGGTITGGTFDAISALKLSVEPYTAMTTGKPLTETIETFELVTLETKLVDDLKVRAGYIEVTDADGNKFYEKIYHGQTLADFMSDMGNLGIYTKLRDDGVLEITGGAFATLSDDRVRELIANGTIRETDDRYKQGTDLLTCLYGAPVISTDQISVASTYSKSKALTHSVIHTIDAELTTTLGTLGLNGNGTAVFNVRGENRTINITNNTTVEGLMNTLKNAGIASSWDSDTHRLTIENATLTGGSSNLGTVLDLTATVSGKYVSSDSLSRLDTITIDATRDTLLSEFGITSSLNANIYDSSGSLKGTMAVNGSTTIGSLIDYMGARGINATIKDGVLVINDGYITNSTLETALGLERSNKSSYALGSIMTVTTTAEVTGATTLGEIISTLGTGNQVSGGYTLLFNSQSLNVSSTTTLDDLIEQVFNKGGSAYIDSTGRLTVKGGTLSGTVANALGITSVTTTNAVSATGNILYTTKEVYADLTTTLSELGINNSSLVVNNSLGNALKTINLTGTTTIQDVFASLKAEGIDGIITNGVIQLSSAEYKYITGNFANAVGITTQTVTEVVNTTSHSTAAITFSGTITASATSTLGQIGAVKNSSDNIIVYNKDGNAIGTINSLSTSSTIQDLFDAVAFYKIDATISDGIISLSSTEGNYIQGSIVNNLGINTNDGYTVTSTIAITQSSNKLNEVIEYNADMNTTLQQLGINNSSLVVHDENGNTVQTLSYSGSDSLNNIFRQLENYGIKANICDGYITISNDNGYYIDGNLANSLGISHSKVVKGESYTVTYISTQTSVYGGEMNGNGALTYTIRTPVTLDDNPFSVAGIPNQVTLIHYNGNTTAGGNNSSNVTLYLNSSNAGTFRDLFELLGSYGINCTLTSEGYITVSNDGAYYIDCVDGLGNGTAFANALGLSSDYTIVTHTVLNSETITTGATMTGSTMTVTEYATRDTLFSNIGISGNLNYSIISFPHAYIGDASSPTTTKQDLTFNTSGKTIGDWLDTLENTYDIKGIVSDGKISIVCDNSPSVDAITCSQLGIDLSDIVLKSSSIVTLKTELTVTMTVSSSDIDATLVSTEGQTFKLSSTGSSVVTISAGAGTVGVTQSSIAFKKQENSYTAKTTSLILYGKDGAKSDKSGNIVLAETKGSGKVTISVSTTDSAEDIAKRLKPYMGDYVTDFVALANYNRTYTFREIGEAEWYIDSMDANFGVGFASDDNSSRTFALEATTNYQTYYWTVDATGTDYTKDCVDINGNQIGYRGSFNILYYIDGNFGYYTFGGTSSINENIEAFNTQTDGRITISFEDDRLTFTPTEGAYIVESSSGADTFSMSTIGIPPGEGVTYVSTGGGDLVFTINIDGTESIGVSTVTVEQTFTLNTVAGCNTISKTLYATVNASGTSAIGASGSITINNNGNSYQVSFSSKNTYNDVFAAIAAHGIEGVIKDGVVTLKANKGAYISTMNSSIATALGLSQTSMSYTTETILTESTGSYLHYYNYCTYDKQLTKTSSQFITGDTQLNAIAGSGTLYITINHNNTTITLDINSDSTYNDAFTALAAYGIEAQIFDGKVRLKGSENSYITGMNNTALNAFNMYSGVMSTTTATTTTTMISTGTADYDMNFNISNLTKHTLQKTVDATFNTTFGALGLGSDGYITVVENGTAYTLTVKQEHSIGDILTALAGYGISGIIQDGTITLNGGRDKFISGISGNLSSITGINAGQNISYNITTSTSKYNTDSKDLNYVTNDIALTEDTVLSSINGFANGNGNLIIHQTNGKFVTIKVDGSSTLSEFFTQISEYGLVGSVDSSGHVSIEGIGNVYMQAASGGSNILTALKLSNVVSNVQTVTVNRTSNVLSRTIKVAASALTQIQNISDTAGNTMGSGNGSIILSTTSNAGNQLVTLTFARTSSIYDVINKLAEYGLQASIDASGKFSVSSSTLTDFSISGNLGNLLMGSYNKVYNKGDTINTSTHLLQTTVNPMTRETALSTFGITNGNIKITQQGVDYVVNINTANIKTVGEFMNLLSEYGFDSDIDSSGRLSISGIGESYLSNVTGGSNILDKFGITNWTLGEITQTSDHLTDHETIVIKPTLETKVSELTNSSGTSLGITSGNIYVYQDGTRYLVNINNDDTLQTLGAKLAQYGITMNLATDGKIYFDGTNDSYMTTQGLTSGASNILQKLNVADNWSTRYDSTSQNLKYTTKTNERISGDTKLSELQDGSGNNLGITEGEVYVYNHGVRTTETINTDMTVNDLMATLARNGLIADIAEDGSISIGAHHNSYLATSATAGANSNLVSTLFSQWDFVNIYTSNNLEIPKDVVVAVNRDTKLKDINEGTYKEGIITVVKDGIQTNITLTSDDTIGTLMDTLGLYGFESVINENGQLILKNTGNSLLQKYTGTNASNALDLLGIDLNSWIQTNTYEGKPLDVIKTSTIDAAATRDTELSLLGVTTGEYFIYNNGVKYTAYISTGETLGSFIDTLKSFGIEASVVTNGNKSVLTITSLGDSYITKSTSTTDSSNVVEKLFGNTNHDSSYKYTGLEQTSEIVTTYSSATEETLLSYYNKPWGAGVLKAEGILSVNVNGENAKIEITADETFGSLMDKFRALGLEATLASDGQLMIQSGYDTFTINTDGTTSNLLATIGLTYKQDLGGFAASSDTTKATTTLIEERTFSVANYADMNTKMGLLNISDGTLSVYKNGQKATIQVKKDETFGQLRSRISTAFADVDIAFEDGYLKFYSKTDGNSIEVGATTDTSNISAICGLTSDGSGTVRSARELFCVNSDTIITNTGLFRKGDVTEGTFTVGDATFNITNTTRMADIIAQINSNDAANATAYWDSIDGKLVIKSRTTGSALINIEAGTSNFTDVMGFTNTERKADGTVNTTRMNINTQDVGKNAKFSINGTSYTSNSNNITSDISRIKGLTINLKGLTDGSAVTITVERDKETLANAVSEIVDAYNELIENVDKAIAKDGQLHNQSVLKIIRNQLRNLMTSSDAGATVFKNLDAIGICTETAKANNISTAGITTLVFNKDKFINAYEADEDALKALLIGSENNTGVLTKIETLVESSLKSVTGYFDTADNSYQKEITKIDNKIERQKKALERYRTQLEAKFASMDILIANMQQQYSSFLKT